MLAIQKRNTLITKDITGKRMNKRKNDLTVEIAFPSR